jgi:hypothetical protein
VIFVTLGMYSHPKSACIPDGISGRVSGGAHGDFLRYIQRGCGFFSVPGVEKFGGVHGAYTGRNGLGVQGRRLGGWVANEADDCVIGTRLAASGNRFPAVVHHHLRCRIANFDAGGVGVT